MSDLEVENADAWIKKGNALGALKKYEEALEAFDEAIDIEPENIGAWINKGTVLGDLKKYEEALKAFDKVIDVDPENAFAWVKKGNALGALKKYEEALEAFDKAIDIDPENTCSWINKGSFLANDLKKYKEALEAFDKAIEVKPKNALAWNNKGIVLGALKKYEEALKAFDKAIEIKPKNAGTWIGKGSVFYNLELYDRALAANIKATAIEPKNKYAWIRKAEIFQDLKKYAECQEALEQAYNIDPNYTYINNFLAEYYLTFGDLKNASKYVENALKINKEDAFSLGLKGKIKIEEHDYVKSSEYFKKAISSDLRNPIYLLWNSYAKYLKAELEFTLDEKKYQDMILAIIRELEKVDTCISHEYKGNLKIIPHWFKNLVICIIKLTKRTLIYFNVNEKLTVRLLERMNLLLLKLESPKIVAYNYYFLGCFYYKINDYFTAVDYLKKCNNLKSDSYIVKSARETLNNIWNNKIRPSIWNWWWYSPINLWFRRFSFVILLLSLFGILLPFLASKLIFSAYNSVFKLIFTYQPASDFPIIKSVMSTIIFL